MDVPDEGHVDSEDLKKAVHEGFEKLKTTWMEMLRNSADDARTLVEDATALIQNALAEADGFHGGLSNALKTMLDDGRFARLMPSGTAEMRVLQDRIAWMLQHLPKTALIQADDSVLAGLSGDAVLTRVHKAVRRTGHRLRVIPRRIGNAWRAFRGREPIPFPAVSVRVSAHSLVRFYLSGELSHVADAWLGHRHAISVLAGEGLRRLWVAVLQGGDHPATSVRGVCEEVLVALSSQQRLAEEILLTGCKNCESAFVQSLERIFPPGSAAIRDAKGTWMAWRSARARRRQTRQWEIFYRGTVGSFDLGLEIVSFKAQTSGFRHRLKGAMDAQVRESLREPLDRMSKRCFDEAEALRGLFASASAQETGSLDTLQDEIEQRIADFSSDYIAHVLKPVENGQAGGPAVVLLGDASEQMARHVGGDCEIWVGEAPAWQPGEPPPDAEILRVPVRDLIGPHLEFLDGECQALRRDLNGVHGGVHDAVVDIWKAVRFNAETAIAELQAATDWREAIRIAEEMTLGSLARAATGVRVLAAEAERQVGALQDRMASGLETIAKKAEKSLQPGGEMDVHLRRYARLARLQAKGYVRLGAGYRAALMARLRLWYAHAKDPVLFAWDRLRRLLGLASVVAQEVHESIDAADLVTVHMDRFPPIYQRLFRMVPLQTDDLLVARQTELELMETALVRWENNRPSALALVGEVGSGKTSLLNCAIPRVFSAYPVYRHAFGETVNTEADLATALCAVFDLPATCVADEVRDALLAHPEPCVFLLEHGYELFMRRIGGLDVIRVFLRLVLTTSPKVFWGFSITESAWRYLDAVVQISNYFPFVIETRNMTSEELEAAVMARHELSGYALDFLPGASRQVLRRLQKVGDERVRQAMLRRIFFQNLAEASKGNVQIALFYWLKSIQDITHDAMRIAPMRALRFDFLNGLDMNSLFALAAFLQHGTLTVREHMEIFNVSQMSSQSVLDVLVTRNVIHLCPVQKEGDLRYVINPVMRHAVIDVLWNRNIFY